MQAKEWFRDATDTNSRFRFSSNDYLEGRALSDITFAEPLASVTVERAYVEPYHSKSVGLVSHGGLRDFGAAFPLFGYHLRVSRNARLVMSARRPHLDHFDEVDFIPGRWLYGGELMHHFGHFMAESSHRLYQVSDYGKERLPQGLAYDGVVFSSRMGLKPFAKELICRYYGISESRLLLVRDRPAIIDELTVVPQGSILGGGPLSSEYLEYLNFYQDRNAAGLGAHGASAPKKLFVGRGHIEGGGGSIQDEAIIEEYVASKGFTSVRPEEYPLLEQLNLFRHAEAVVGIGGSFVHLFDHLGQTNAATFLISRGDPDGFYHDRSLDQKVAALEYYQPRAERGDEVVAGERDGRTHHTTRYRRDLLLDALSTFLNKHA